MNGLDILIAAIFIIAGCVIAYYWGLSDGRKQMLAERIEDLLNQERRRDEVALHHLDGDPTNNEVENLVPTRKCSICGDTLQFDDGRFWHTNTNPVARGRHAPVPGPIEA
ncbi:MAG: hypothetical protein MUO37_05130 [Methyloceanibacter sp.]|nr:hypothetical protein [Methyloceanibacter sp.]